MQGLAQSDPPFENLPIEGGSSIFRQHERGPFQFELPEWASEVWAPDFEASKALA